MAGKATSPKNTTVASQIGRAPKVLLHDHLDGGLRPKTVIDLADELGYDGLPTTNEYDLREWFKRGANRHNLTLYLETFAHTVGVMQSVGALERVAAECAEDLAADGVIYAEVRFAPELHVGGGLTLDEVVGAVVNGFEQGSRGRGIRIGTLCTAMRHATHSRAIAELAVRWRDRGVVGFDIAGAEDGFPPTLHLDAFEYCRRENFHFTIHAGEAYGPKSIWEAIQYCGAERLGHGVRIRDAISFDADGRAQLDHLAAYVRDRRIPLEVCPSSNVHTGVSATIAEHPIKLLVDLAFRVTVNTDNRLMSDCSMTSEMVALHDAFGWDLTRMSWLTINAMKSAFIPFDERLELINTAIKPGYEMLLGESAQGTNGD